MHKGLPYSATQIVAGCAVVSALLGAAYAVGRSQSLVGTASPPTGSEPSASVLAAPRWGTSSAAAASQGAPATSVPPTANAKVMPSPPTTTTKAMTASDSCLRCGTVVEVRSERRQGEASGLGAVGGAVLGGILGHQVGGGTGKQIATVGGAVAGGYAGNEVEKRQRSHTIWVVVVREADGQMRRFERRQLPDVRAGDEVQLTERGFARR